MHVTTNAISKLTLALAFLALASSSAFASNTLVILPDVDVYVDSQNPTNNYKNKPLEISSSKSNQPEKIAFARYDLSGLPAGATITQAQFQQVVPNSPSGALPQQVTLSYVADNTWADTINYKSKPADTGPNVGQWFFPGGAGNIRVSTPANNPLLVSQLTSSQASGAISIQISSNTARAGAGTDVTYASYDSATQSKTYSYAPRLILEYTPATGYLARNWNQWQGDGSRTGQIGWKYAQSPSASGITSSTIAASVNAPSAPIIYNSDLYVFSGVTLAQVSPSGTVTTLQSALPNAYLSTAVGPDSLIYAQAKSSLGLLDLSQNGKLTSSLALNNASKSLASGATNAALCIENSNTLSAVVIRENAISYSWQYVVSPTPAAISSPSLSADGQRAYLATSAGFYAINATNGDLLWSYTLSPAATTIQSPVVANDGSNTVYFAADKSVYAFQDTGTPLQGSPITASDTYAQPVLNASKQLIALSGTTLASISTTGGTVSKGATKTLSGFTASANIQPTLDGNGNLYLIDNAQKLFVVNSTFAPVISAASIGGMPANPAIQLSPNGTLYTPTTSGIIALDPVTPDTVSISTWQTNTAYRAEKTLSLPSSAVPDLCNLILHSKGTIEYPDSMSVPIGAVIVNQTGY